MRKKREKRLLESLIDKEESTKGKQNKDFQGFQKIKKGKSAGSKRINNTRIRRISGHR